MNKPNSIHLLFLSLLMSLGMGTIYAQNIDLESLGKGKLIKVRNCKEIKYTELAQ